MIDQVEIPHVGDFIQRQDELQAGLSQTLGVKPAEITFLNAQTFFEGEGRYLLGTTRYKNDDGFLKIARPDDFLHLSKLRKEITGMQVAQALGIPSVDIFHLFHETTDRYGLIHVSFIDGNTGVLLSNKALVAEVDPSYGTVSARALSQFIRQKIPDAIDTSALDVSDPRMQSAASFQRMWNECIQSALLCPTINDLLGQQGLLPKAREIQESVLRFVDQGEDPSSWYFYHGDQAPTNMFHPRPGIHGPVIFLDFENAGKTRNWATAAIAELADFYRSCTYNRELQQEFLRELMNLNPLHSASEMKTLLRAVVVFGTLLHGNKRFDPMHKEHDEGVLLLSNLSANFDLIDTSE